MSGLVELVQQGAVRGEELREAAVGMGEVRREDREVCDQWHRPCRDYH